MSYGQLFSTDAVGDVMLLGLRDGTSRLADQSILGELDEIRQLRHRIGFKKLIIDLAHAPFLAPACWSSSACFGTT